MIFHGRNLIPEQFETGEYVIGGTAEIDDLEPVYLIAYAEDTYGHSYNGIFSGIMYLAYSNADLLRSAIFQIATSETGADHIITIFTVPKLAFNNVPIPEGEIDKSFLAPPRPVNLKSRPNDLDGYIPKNNKLLTYPYIYLAYNPCGNTGKIFRYEDFTNATPYFEMISEINPNPTVCVIPHNYKHSNR